MLVGILFDGLIGFYDAVFRPGTDSFSFFYLLKSLLVISGLKVLSIAVILLFEYFH